METTPHSRLPAARVDDPLRDARQVLESEIAGLRAVQARLDERFVRTLDLLYQCSGRVIVTGLGKSGIVAKKIAATLTSTGTRSLYLHPVEAAHGDMGILAPEDVLLVVSYSGANDELDEILPLAEVRIDIEEVLGRPAMERVGGRALLERRPDLLALRSPAFRRR